MPAQKIGICEWSLPIQGPAVCEFAHHMGFDGVQLDLGEAEKNFPLSYTVVQDLYMANANKFNIEFPSIAIRQFDQTGMTNNDGTKEKDIVYEAIEKAVLVAERMNIPLIMMGSFEDGEIKDEAGFQNTVECLKYACELAEPKNIDIATENILSTEENIRLFQAVDKNNLGLYFDTQNYPLRRNFNAATMIEELSAYIKECHVKDGVDGEMSNALLGEGESNFYGSLHALKNIAYKQWINIENYYYLSTFINSSLSLSSLVQKDLTILKESIE